MSFYEYIDVDSTYRDRCLYPNPASFQFSSSTDSNNLTSNEIQVFPSITTPLTYTFTQDIAGSPYNDIETYQAYNLPLMYQLEPANRYLLDWLPSLQSNYNAQFPDAFNNAYPNYYLENVVTGEYRQIERLEYNTTTNILHNAIIESYEFLQGRAQLTLFAFILNQTRPSNIPNIYVGKTLLRPLTNQTYTILGSSVNEAGNVVFILSNTFTQPIEAFEEVQIQTSQQWIVSTDQPFTSVISEYPAYLNTPNEFSEYTLTRTTVATGIAYSDVLNKTVVVGIESGFGVSYISDILSSSSLQCSDNTAIGCAVVWIPQNQLFFAVAYQGVEKQYVSYDGKNFISLNTNINGISFGRILLVNDTIVIYPAFSSTTLPTQGIAVANVSSLTSWTQVTSPILVTIIHDGTQFVGISQSGVVFDFYTSPDAINWTLTGNLVAGAGFFPSLAYSPTASTYILTVGYIYKTPDLINWSLIITTVVPPYIFNVFYSSVWDLFVAFYNSSQCLRSRDGLTWTNYSLNSSLQNSGDIFLVDTFVYSSNFPQGHMFYHTTDESVVLFTNMAPRSNNSYLSHNVLSFTNKSSTLSYTISADIFVTSTSIVDNALTSPLFFYDANRKLMFTNKSIIMTSNTLQNNFPTAYIIRDSSSINGESFGLAYIDSGISFRSSDDNYNVAYTAVASNYDINTILLGTYLEAPLVFFTYTDICYVAYTLGNYNTWTTANSLISATIGCLYEPYAILVQSSSNVIQALQYFGGTLTSYVSYTIDTSPDFHLHKPCVVSGKAYRFIAYQINQTIRIIATDDTSNTTNWQEFGLPNVNDVAETNKRLAGFSFNNVLTILYHTGTKVQQLISYDETTWLGPFTIYEASDIYDIQCTTPYFGQLGTEQNSVVVAHGNTYTQLILSSDNNPLPTPYRIRKYIPNARLQNQGLLDLVSSTAVVGNDEFSDTNNDYKNDYMWLVSSQNKASPVSTITNSYRPVIEYNGTTKLLSFEESIVPPLNPYIWELWKTNAELVELNVIRGIVPMNQFICYQIELVSLILPNQQLQSGYGNRIAFYPYIYVRFYPINHPYYDMLYSMNPNAKRILFKVPINNVNTPTISPFVVLTPSNCINTAKFMLNTSFCFDILLPDGSLFLTNLTDTTPPQEPNPFLQVSATFRLKRLNDR